MKKLVVLVFYLSINLYAQMGWNPVFEGELGGFYFADSINGISYFNGSLNKTTDGGHSWESFYRVDAGVIDIKFFNENLGIAICDSGQILKSTDNGNSWRVISTKTEDPLSSVSYHNGILWMANFSGLVLKSVDLGETWESKQTPAWNLTDLEFCTNEIGWGVGYYDITVKTTDGGETWSLTDPIIEGRSMFDIEFVDSTTGFVIGGSNIATTTNSGESWEIILDAEGTQLNSIAAFNKNYAWVVGSNLIYHTTNGGRNWHQQTFSPSSYLTIVKCVDSMHAWIKGSPFLYRTTDGGGSGNPTEITDGEPVRTKKYILFQNHPNPFNPSTTIIYELPEYSYVTLKVYDLLGREVTTLIDKEQTAGHYEVNFSAGSVGNGSDLNSGIYFYQLKSGDFVDTKKLILIK